MAKKKKIDSKKLKKEIMGGSEEDQMQRMIKILLIVVLFIGLVWFIFAIINGEIFHKKKGPEKEEVEIQNDIILAGSTFNRNEEEYYVLLYDFKGPNSGACNAIFTVYNDKDSIKMFKVDLGDKMNSNVLVTDAGNVNYSNSAALKVFDATLIKVKDGKAIEVISGINELNAYKSNLLD